MTPKITALIVDDEQDARDGLERLIENEIPELEIIGKAENAQNALEMIVDESPEIVFLDIQMPGKDGFWLADKLGKLQLETCIIFVTAYDEYAIEAIKHSAFDFLTKPISPELLKSTIDRFREKRKTYNLNYKLDKLKSFLRQDRVKFNNRNGFVILNANDIVFCKADKNYCKTVLANGKTELITMQLGSVEDKLDKESFIRINRSTLVNLDYLENFNRKTRSVILSDILQKYEFKVSASGLKRLNGL